MGAGRRLYWAGMVLFVATTIGGGYKAGKSFEALNQRRDDPVKNLITLTLEEPGIP